MPIINADESFLALSSDTLTSLCSSTREEIRECLENALSGQVTEQKLRRLLPSWHYGWLKRGDDKLNNFDVAKLV